MINSIVCFVLLVFLHMTEIPGPFRMSSRLSPGLGTDPLDGVLIRGPTVNIKIYSVHIGTRLSHDVSKLRTDLLTTQTPRRRESSLILSGWN
jgi:hypothetical protein